MTRVAVSYRFRRPIIFIHVCICIINMQEIGKMFPDIKLSVVMDAESKFNQADINGDGVSDTVGPLWTLISDRCL